MTEVNLSNVSSITLTKEQLDIVNTGANTIVVSNPGTGKTFTLSLKVMKLLEEGVRPEDILCMTFTEKAKNEIYEKLGGLATKTIPASEIMKVNIRTFHGFAYDYLQKTGLVRGDILSENFMRFQILESFERNKSLNYSKDYIVDDLIPKVTWAIRYLKGFGILPDSVNLDDAIKQLDTLHANSGTKTPIDELKAFMKYLLIAYREYECSKNGAIDYSDMLLVFLDKFQGPPFDHVLVDEMQDMSRLESELVKRVSKSIFLVGDAKQAIFGFQGGSINNIESFATKCQKKLLSINMRSTQQILDYSKNHFMNNTKSPQIYRDELDSFKSSRNGSKPIVFSTEAVAAKILEVISKNPNKTIGILARKRHHLIEISKHLDANAVVYSSTSTQATAKHAFTEIISCLKGLLSEKTEDKVIASFTVFSPFSMQEAFEFSNALINKDEKALQRLINFGISLGKKELDEVFEKRIIPISISKGFEWYSTALSVKILIDDYLSFGTPTMQGLFDFVAISEESNVEKNTNAEIILSTVHKAKGLAFDVVVYIPDLNHRKFSLIDLTVESIMLSKQIDVKEDLEEESLRIDFVAFTRAKDVLIIIARREYSDIYHEAGFSEFGHDGESDKNILPNVNSKTAEAYSLFVNKRYKEAEALLETKDDWLRDFIRDYFTKLERFSYTMVKTDAYEFLRKSIIRIPWGNTGLSFGSTVHRAIEESLDQTLKTGNREATNPDKDVAKAVANAFAGLDELKVKYPGLKLETVENKTTITLDFFDKSLPPLFFTGKIDAVFTHPKGIVIVDFKTDKKDDHSSEHNRQLAVYRKMLSKTRNIPENSITTHIIYVALRGNVSTGKFGMSITKNAQAGAFTTFLEHLKTIIEWKENPDLFIQKLLDSKDVDPLLGAIKEKLI